MRGSRILKVALAVVLVIAASAVVGAVWTVRRSFPQHGGTLRLPGLSAPVTVYRDTNGIPNVYAESAPDLFRAQGFVHAQDRFWEMDFRRHVTAGRLAELFGADQVETDTYLRTMGWRRVAEREWWLISAEARTFLTAYAEGVNAWLTDHSGGSASLEYTLLPGYEIEPWTPVDSLAWLKAMAWDLRGNMDAEIRRAALVAYGLTREQVDELYPPYPFVRNLPIVPDVGGNAPARQGAAATLPIPALDRLAAGLRRVPTGKAGTGIGSNSWVVAGAHTMTGKPILANDPHLSPTMPGIWYQMGLHCTCGYEVSGFTFSGLPGVVIGHNTRVAWGFTNLGPDVTDLYLERVDGDRVQVGAEWRSLEKTTEVIKVAGGDPVPITIRRSPHGPLLSDASEELRRISGDAVPAQTLGVALRWTALDPGRTIEAIFAVNRAADWAGFRAAAALFEVPSQNMVYADVDGNIGYQSPGRIPVRGKGDGRWMAPGWDPAYDWTGMIPFGELPSVLNPPRGYIVTANQAVTGPAYSHLLTTEWAYGARSQRINTMINAATSGGGKVSVAGVQRMQFDNRNDMAPVLVPVILGVAADTPLLRAWDFQQPESSAPAALYNAIWRHLLLRTFDELGPDYRPDGGDRWFEVLRGLLAQPQSAWWDAKSTSDIETRDDIVRAAVRDAEVELRRTQGGDPQGWRWGRMHTLTVENQTFGTSGIGPIEWLFNRGPAPVSGGDAIVNATGWDAAAGYQVDAVPSMRMIVDMSRLDSSRWIQLTGNSGHAFHPNYHDQFELWRTGGTLSMRWDRAGIERTATGTLRLRP